MAKGKYTTVGIDAALLNRLRRHIGRQMIETGQSRSATQVIGEVVEAYLSQHEQKETER